MGVYKKIKTAEYKKSQMFYRDICKKERRISRLGWERKYKVSGVHIFL